MTSSELNILAKAREIYGNKNQILVSIEELSELACVLAKYGRYEQHETAVKKLRDNVIDEMADVTTVTSHIKSIFDITNQDINDRVALKLERLDRWMRNSESFEQTTIDRKVGTKN
ncbi:MAG: hypothetical protein RR490_00465 [Niameybacter sp.]